MKRVDRRRWTLWGSALALTLLAIAWPVQAPLGDDDVVAAAEPRRAANASPQTGPLSDGKAAESLAEAGPARTDPFAPRTWRPAEILPMRAEPATPLRAVPVAGPPPVAAPSGPPPLPYRYVGRLQEGGADILYLARGEQSLVLRVGDTVEGLYRVLAIGARQIEFEHLASGERQSLPLPQAE